MRTRWLPLAMCLLPLTACGLEPGSSRATLRTTQASRPAGAPAIQAATQPAAAGPGLDAGARVLPGVRRETPFVEPETPAEPDENSAETSAGVDPEAAGGIQAEAPAAPRAYAEVERTDAAGRALTDPFTDLQAPVYLTPRHYPLILPGSPAPLPAFSPRPVDVSKLPTDAIVELARLGRLRQRRRGALAWLVGYSFPKLTAEATRARLAAGGSIWLAPSGSHWHRDRAYSEVKSAAVLDAMLEDLRRAALDAAARVAREANIEGRMLLLPAFNNTFDVYKLWLLERVIDGYSFGGEPVRRGVVTAASLHEQREVRRRVATYWEDHPGCTAGELRTVTTSALVSRFADLERSAATYAANPAAYLDVQCIPGLRDPRPVLNGDRRWYDTDVRYNEEAIRTMCQSMPQVLRSAVYP
ncbi:MAG: hypothetical protein VKP62_01565 [Candidatus Sericytochromatia bacterium]|nr:hypothetical protein [Candidatus Sericytochromatia bacterium]